MGAFFTTLLIAVSLSMDAFSLSLAYGMQQMTKKDKILLSVIVGIYHFFMPLIGLNIGGAILKYIIIDISILVCIIFSLIGLEMIVSSIKEKEDKILISLIGFLIFGFSVSIDSFTMGIGLNMINNNYLEVTSIFAIVSATFTYLGLLLGNKLNLKYGKYSTILGGSLLIILGIYYLVK